MVRKYPVVILTYTGKTDHAIPEVQLGFERIQSYNRQDGSHHPYAQLGLGKFI